MATQDDARRQFLAELSSCHSLKEFKEKLRAKTRADYAMKICVQVQIWQNTLGSGGEPPSKEDVVAFAGVDVGNTIYKLLVPRMGGAVGEESATMAFNPAIHVTSDQQSPATEFDANATSLFGSAAPRSQPQTTTPPESDPVVRIVAQTLLLLAKWVEKIDVPVETRAKIVTAITRCAEEVARM